MEIRGNSFRIASGSKQLQQESNRWRGAADVVEVADVGKDEREVALAHAEPESEFGEELVATGRGNESSAAGVERVRFRA